MHRSRLFLALFLSLTAPAIAAGQSAADRATSAAKARKNQDRGSTERAKAAHQGQHDDDAAARAMKERGGRRQADATQRAKRSRR